MNDKHPDFAVCAVCLLFGVVLPWVMLVGAALLSQFSNDPSWHHTAAVMVAGSMILFLLSAGLQRKSRRLHEQGHL